MAGTDIRYSVQRPAGYRQDGEWDDVGAAGGFEVDAGSLLFFDETGKCVIAYAPHAWETVVPA